MKCTEGIGITTAIIVGTLVGIGGTALYKSAVNTLKDQGRHEANAEVVEHNENVAEQVIKEMNEEIVEDVKNRKEIEKGLRSDDPKEKARAAFKTIQRSRH